MDLNQLIFHNPIPVESSLETDLLAASLNSVTSVIHSLLKLPERIVVNDQFEIILPDYDATKYPRSKPLPKAKPLTKWESFAAKKGIKSRKKTLSTFKDGELRPAWGYKSKDPINDWCMEVPSKYHHETKDMYEIKSEEALAKKNKITKKQDKNAERLDPKSLVEKRFLHSKKSTASLGKFDSKLRNEIKSKRSKQSFSSNISKNPKSEVESGLLIANKLKI